MLEVRLFGGGRLLDGSQELKIPSRKWTLPLLAYALLQNGKRVPRKRLAFTLWPDDTEDAALVNLRRNLHRLLQLLPASAPNAPWLLVDAESVAWNVSSPYQFDVLAYEKLRGDRATLEAGVALYSGDFLDDFHEDWIAAERERLRGLYQADLNALIVGHRSRRDFSAAANFAQQLLASDPWREDALRALMTVRYEAGDAAGALSEFDRFARALRADMNVDPMPETVALRDAVARGAPLPTTPASLGERARRAPAEAPFVGRQDELERMRARWMRSAGGNGGLAFVRGEAGMGKSRLVAELALIAEAQGGRVIAGTTSFPERDLYQCLSSALRDQLPLVAAVGLAPQLLAALAELVPELRSFRPDIPPAARLDPKSESARLLDAIAQTFVGLARPRPLLVILEDLHWAETATIEAIRGIVPRLSRSAVLLVATYRPEEVSRKHPLRELVRSTGALSESTDLPPLSEREIAQLVEALAAALHPRPEFFASLTRQSDGNPLFVTELLRDRQGADDGAPAIPASIGTMISARLASVSPAARSVAEIAAVAGEAFSIELVEDVAGLPPGEVLDGLDELLDRHLVRESTRRGTPDYAFTHHLVHAAAYEISPSAMRSRRHRRVARILAELEVEGSDERAAEIALHFERGGDPANAALHYAHAAKRAARLYANVEARELAGRALALYTGGERDRFEILLLRSTVCARLADVDSEKSDLREAEAIAARLDEDARCAVLDRRVGLAFRQMDRAAEVANIELLTARAAVARDERWRGLADELRSKREEADGAHPRALETALRGITHYERAGDRIACARLTSFAARISGMVPGHAGDARRLAAEAVRLADNAGDAEVRFLALREAGQVAEEQLDHGPAAEFARAALELSLQIGDRRHEVNARGLLATALWGDWRVAEAVLQYREALRIAEALDLTQRMQNLECDLGGMLIAAGDFENGLDLSRRARDEGLALGSVPSAAVAAANIVEAAWLRGDVEAMEAELSRAAALVSRLSNSRFVTAFTQNEARLLRCRRQFEASAKMLEESSALDRELGRWANAAEALDDLALTHLGSGNVKAAESALQRSAGVAGDRARPDAIRHHWVDACVRRAAGDVDGARRAVARGHREFIARRAALGDRYLEGCFDAMPVNGAVCRARVLDQWPPFDSPCVVAFPGSAFDPPGTVSGRSQATI